MCNTLRSIILSSINCPPGLAAVFLFETLESVSAEGKYSNCLQEQKDHE